MSRIKRHKVKKSLKREEPKKEGLSKQAILTIFLGALMVLSVFGIMFGSYSSGGEKLEYGEQTFKRTDTGWSTEIDGERVEFTYFPSDLEELNISKDVVDKLLDSKVAYVTFNPSSENVQNLELMRFELQKSFSQLFGTYMMLGITEPSDVYAQPLIDCTNATAKTPVISIVESNMTNAFIDGDCIVLETEEYSVIALKDRLLYSMLGIIQ